MYTSDFRVEFEADTSAQFHRRLEWFLLVWGGLGAIAAIVRWGGLLVERYLTGGNVAVIGPHPDWKGPELQIAGAVDCLWLALYAFSWVLVRSRSFTQESASWLATLVVILDGALLLIADAAWPRHEGAVAVWFIFGILLTHVTAVLFLPWSMKDAARPIVWIALIASCVAVMFKLDAGVIRIAGWVGLVVALGVPGVVVAWIKHSRRMEQYKLRFLTERYSEVKRELTDARRIHESLFPKAHGCPRLRFAYEYEPMRQIGGDYVYASGFGPGDGSHKFSVVLVDVTGHGIAAALTVNRLYGELQRLFAEHPDIAPGNVLKLLNRYVHLTLANHSVYATALCIRVDTRNDILEYASGGHPPPFLRAVDGTIQELESTSFVLGACADPDFDAAPRAIPFAPGDVLLAYTDGAIESKDATGRMLGVAGMRALVASAPMHLTHLRRRSLSHRPLDGGEGEWTRLILQAVEQHRSGPPEDDTLVVEIARPIAPTPPRPRSALDEVRETFVLQ
jgi:serine phosphatase RsbU (regulator of sigma subunit)